MKLARFSRNPTSPLDRTNGINLNYTHARTYEQLLSRLVRAVSFEDRHSAGMPIKNGPLVDGRYEEATRRQLTHFSVIIQPAKRGLGSLLGPALLFKSISEHLEQNQDPAARIFLGLDSHLSLSVDETRRRVGFSNAGRRDGQALSRFARGRVRLACSLTSTHRYRLR